MILTCSPLVSHIGLSLSLCLPLAKFCLIFSVMWIRIDCIRLNPVFPSFYTSRSGSTDLNESGSDQIRIHITGFSSPQPEILTNPPWLCLDYRPELGPNVWITIVVEYFNYTLLYYRSCKRSWKSRKSMPSVARPWCRSTSRTRSWQACALRKRGKQTFVSWPATWRGRCARFGGTRRSCSSGASSRSWKRRGRRRWTSTSTLSSTRQRSIQRSSQKV